MKKILVTGASSFLGHHVLPLLKQYATAVAPEIPSGGRGIKLQPRFEILAPSSKELDLLNRDDVVRYVRTHKPDTILHMAALCGGIGANKKRPGEFILDNTKMAINLFDAISEANHWPNGINGRFRDVVTHFYGLGSVCGYPKHCPVPFTEDNIWNGYPEENNAPYGTAKRHLMVMQDAYRKQFGLKGAHLVPVNLFGSYDHFDFENSHVIPALIRKFIDAKNNRDVSVEVWGNGTREFLYAGDCAEAIVKAVTTQLDYDKPINIGTGHDISIRDLAYLIKEVVGFDGEIEFTGEVSVNGQPKRCLDVSRAKEVLGFTAETTLKEGLKKMVSWYNVYRITPVKEAMKNEETVSKRRAEAIARLNRVIVLLEKNIEEVFDQIQNNPGSTKTDYAFQKYMEMLNLSLERVKNIRDSEFKKENDSEIESDILKNPGPSIYVKAIPQKSQHVYSDLIERFVKDIRNSIGDAELLGQLADRVDSIKPDLNEITEENKEFLLSLIKRVQRAQPAKSGVVDELKKVPLPVLYSCIGNYDSWKKLHCRNAIDNEIKKREVQEEKNNTLDSLVKKGDVIRRHLRTANESDALIKKEELKLTSDIENARKRLNELEARRQKFFTNLKEINLDTGEVKVFDYTATDFFNKKVQLSELNIPKKEEVEKNVEESKDHLSGVGGYPSEVASKSEELKKYNTAHGHKGQYSPVEFLIRSGLGKEVAHQRIRESIGFKPGYRETLKALGIDPLPEATPRDKEIDVLADKLRDEHLKKMAQEVTKEDGNQPKHNRVRRIDESGSDVEFEKKLTPGYAKTAAANSMKEAKEKLAQRASETKPPESAEKIVGDLYNKPVPSGKQESLKEYEVREAYKSEKAQDALFKGGAAVRRGENPKEEPGKSPKRTVKTTKEHEKDFTDAIDAFEKEYEIPVFDAKRNKRGKRFSGDYYKVTGISDVEIMAASMVSPNIEIPQPFKKATNANFTCPKENKEEAKEVKDKIEGKVNIPKPEPKVEPEVIKTEKKVEKKEKITFIGTAKKFISPFYRLWSGQAKK